MDQIVSLAGAGYRTDPGQVNELTGYKVTLDPAKAPALANRGTRKPRATFKKQISQDAAPLADRLKSLLALQGAEFSSGAKALRADLPKLLEEINSDPESADLLAEIFGEAFVEGITS